MEENEKSFDAFLKTVVSKDSHPIYHSFLTRKKIWKIFIIDSILKGMIFGVYAVKSEISARAALKSWKMILGYIALSFSTLCISIFLN